LFLNKIILNQVAKLSPGTSSHKASAYAVKMK